MTSVSSFGSTMKEDEDEDAFGDDTNYDVPLWGDGGTSAMQSNTLELDENQGFGSLEQEATDEEVARSQLLAIN
jgi:hypothetical protein